MNEQEVFAAALEQEANRRATFLDETCGADAELRRRIENLLQCHDRAGAYFEKPAAEIVATAQLPPITETTGTQIGPYTLLHEIGEGGMGAVYLAEQNEPVRRRVALKIIKPGMDTRQVIARFEAERQALSLMDHPNIAKVLDAGTTESGRPYFVMELVKGQPITQYCDEHHLTPRQRLELLLPVCQAIQHAHQKGIIHRDIKPTNILVAEYDQQPVPKVIDFGVAKAISQTLTEQTAFTGYGQIVGTLEYMSPEQAKVNQLDIDTRSDIYSLGVLLYELLTGSTPFDIHRLRSSAWDEMLRIIREEEPPKPSTRLSDSKDSLPSISAQRHMEPAKLTKLVRGELDWIVMKALDKDRTRRYETASGLADDIQKYLHDEPVLACPPSAAYRVKKFLKRNKGPVAAVAVVLLALVGGIMGTTWGLVRAEKARRDAVAAQLAESERAAGERKAKLEALAAVQAEKKARGFAQAREAEMRAVLDFVENQVFAAARPEGQEGGLGREVMLRQAIEAAVPFVEESFTGQPLIEARLRMTLGRSFQVLGEAKTAAEQFQIARTIYLNKLGPDDASTLLAARGLAIGYSALGRHADALKIQEETLALRRAQLGPNHSATLLDMNNLAASYLYVGRHADALKLFDESLARNKAALGRDHPDTLTSMGNLANAYAALGRGADALKLREETLALMKAKLGRDHHLSRWMMALLATNYSNVGRNGEALSLHEEALALNRAKLGPDHPTTLQSMHQAAVCYTNVGRNADALKLHEERLTYLKTKLGPEHPDTLECMRMIGSCYQNLGRYTEALKLHEETLALRKRKLGPDHSDTLVSMSLVAQCLVELDCDPVATIDECLGRAAGKALDPKLIRRLGTTRLRHFQKAKDAAGCRATAEMFEKLKSPDATDLYDRACYRAVTAAVLRATDNSETAAKEAAAEADRAMAWLKQAIAAGYKNAGLMKTDKDLDALRDRGDFQTFLADLEVDQEKQKK